MHTITTQRLGLRNWRPSDMPEFGAMNSDPEVMKFFPATIDLPATTEFCQRLTDHFEQYGFTYFAVEKLSDGQFIGFIGLLNQTYESPFTPNVDIGWRLKPAAWGHGYASEGAAACLKFAFENIGLNTVISIAPKINTPSIHVMRKIGMVELGEFNHPSLSIDSPLNPCVAYSIENNA